jgi:hypothetical protein
MDICSSSPGNPGVSWGLDRVKSGKSFVCSRLNWPEPRGISLLGTNARIRSMTLISTTKVSPIPLTRRSSRGEAERIVSSVPNCRNKAFTISRTSWRWSAVVRRSSSSSPSVHSSQHALRRRSRRLSRRLAAGDDFLVPLNPAPLDPQMQLLHDIRCGPPTRRAPYGLPWSMKN